MVPNEWERLAAAWFPQHIGRGDYKHLAMELAAMQENKIVDRFCSVNEQARWLTKLLGWEVDPYTLRRQIDRFDCRDNSKPEPAKYLIFKQIVPCDFGLYYFRIHVLYEAKYSNNCKLQSPDK